MFAVAAEELLIKNFFIVHGAVVVALEQKLDALDRDLSILALSVEMAK